IEQIQSNPQTADGDILQPPPPIMPTANILNPPTKLNNIADYNDVELEEIDDFEEIEDIEDIEEINSAPPMLKSADDAKVIEVDDDEIDEIVPDKNSKTNSNRLRPRARRHRRK
ncbi:MAG: hypothetical protein KAR20_04085, partial [Candidatus Heimdallarchaeota archaeon]|nr:hypothetical protein [Candidatus Heimdallarchaeota archaeon]